MTSIQLLEHSSAHYAPRTYENATSADLTVAFAMDFSTAGEKLTKKAAGQKFVEIDLRWDSTDSARYLYQQLRRHQARTLNIAGNGMYTLSKLGWNDALLDSHLFKIIQLCHTHWPLTSIRSGGQTGVDESGLVAAYALSISSIGLYPKGFKQRSLSGVDMDMSKADLEAKIIHRAMSLLSS